MVSGSVDELRDGEFNIILGQELALVLGVSVGDKVTVVTPQVTSTPAGMMPRLKRFTVAGIFAVGMQDYVPPSHLHGFSRPFRPASTYQPG